ncbi:MAG: DNA ligase D [Thermoanaerobaculia bacterium]
MAPKSSSGDRKAAITPAAALLRRVFPPMLATLASAPPPDPESWQLELKYDGFRGVAALHDGDLALWSRNGLDLAERFPSIAAALRRLRSTDVVLDGEIVALDRKGTPRFQLLQRGEGANFVYFVFDVLWMDGEDLRRLPLAARRERLERVLRKPPAAIRISETLDAAPQKALARAAREGWEGLIAKRLDSKYEGKRTKDWLKLKAHNEQELAVIGFTPSTHSDQEIGALLLGVAEGGVLRFAGKVGTGFSTKQRKELKRELSKDSVARTEAVGAPRMRDATWVKPRLVAQVKFTEWTSDGKLRHPSFLGLRDDKTPMEAIREIPAEPPGKKSSTANRRKAQKKPNEGKGRRAESKSAKVADVNLTHPDRLLYPRDGYTKSDVADYYAAVSEPMLRALRDRPIALEHWNEGIERPSWFQQDVSRDVEEWMTTVETPAKTTGKNVRHLIVDRPETLRWLAQRSVLTLHMWSSRAASLASPDWVVFDLDPARGKGIEQAVEAALVLRRLFEELEIPSVPKTSGKRGIHLFVPLVKGYSHEETAAFAEKVAVAIATKVPSATVERNIAKRGGRLYLDWLQNGYGKTVVAPYSLRAIEGAPVSAPLRWSEVTRRLDPSRYDIRTMPGRIAKVGDLFERALEGGVRLPKLG